MSGEPFGWRTERFLRWALGDLSNNRHFIVMQVTTGIGGGIIGALAMIILPFWGWIAYLVLLLAGLLWCGSVPLIRSRRKR